MSTPEISRRCLACGAAVRAGARFCHQCGGEVGKGSGPVSGGEVAEAEAEKFSAPPSVVDAPDVPDTEHLKGDWARWEESVGAHAERGDGREIRRGDDSPVGDARGETRAPAVDSVRDAGQVSAGAPVAAQSDARSADAHEVDADAGERAAGVRRHPAVLVKENLRPRVERMREASIVVMDEGVEDSGLRFVLIAVVLFLLFLLFLFISSFLR